jgi:hypothetical protein
MASAKTTPSVQPAKRPIAASCLPVLPGVSGMPSLVQPLYQTIKSLTS